MIRGAFIFAVGLTLGYAKALQENVNVLEKIEEMGNRFVSYIDTLAETGDNASDTPTDSQGETPS